MTIMLSRRFLRIKTMQALYSYFKNEKPDMSAFEKELFKSIDQVYDLYLIILYLLKGMHQNALMIMDENKNKRLPQPEDLNPNTRFVDNAILLAIAESKDLQEQIEKRKLQHVFDNDLMRKLLTDLRKSTDYEEYMAAENGGLNRDRQILIFMVVKIFNESEILNSIIEDKNIYWADDLHAAYTSVIKTLELTEKKLKLLPLYKDESDDKEFVKMLFQKTILYKETALELIKKNLKNWELDRVAEMDILLMQMCISEFLHLPQVPVKASLNEYIDISKEYSTPNSKVFINGILDKIVMQLKTENLIQKQGRGLKDN
jgi:transcription antitermination protein NusB